MVVKGMKIRDAVYRSFKIGKLFVSVDRVHLCLVDSNFDPEKSDKDFDICHLCEYEQKEFWKAVDFRKRYKRGVKHLLQQIKSFIADYRVSPILGFDGDVLKTGYEGRKRGFRTKGWFKFVLQDPDWFQSLELPKAPKRLTEVFK